MHSHSIEAVSESYLCCNCGACKAVCPKNAIDFRTTSIGRLYAYVSEDCIDCGICRKVCPTLESYTEASAFENLVGNVSSVSVGKATDKTIFENSQSGGLCTAILKYLFDTNKIDGALVCRMDYGYPVPHVSSTIISSSDELADCQKSCYSPLELLSILKEKYETFNSIAVVGIGCHIEGLSRIEKINKIIASKIYCRIGLICDRTLCGTIQDVYASYVPHFQAIKIAWRCKSLLRKDLHLRYKDAPLIIEDRDGDYKAFPNDYRFALKDMFTSPRCRVCPNKMNLFSDITLGDPWGMSDIDWENGESLIIGRTERGEDILRDAEQSGYFTLSARPLNQVIRGQLINKRKFQISAYSEAFHVLKPTVETYLLPNSSNCHNDTESTRKAEIEYMQFIQNENADKAEIIKIARKTIKLAMFRKTLIYRVFFKLYRILNTLIRR